MQQGIQQNTINSKYTYQPTGIKQSSQQQTNQQSKQAITSSKKHNINNNQNQNIQKSKKKMIGCKQNSITQIQIINQQIKKQQFAHNSSVIKRIGSIKPSSPEFTNNIPNKLTMIQNNQINVSKQLDNNNRRSLQEPNIRNQKVSSKIYEIQGNKNIRQKKNKLYGSFKLPKPFIFNIGTDHNFKEQYISGQIGKKNRVFGAQPKLAPYKDLILKNMVLLNDNRADKNHKNIRVIGAHRTTQPYINTLRIQNNQYMKNDKKIRNIGSIIRQKPYIRVINNPINQIKHKKQQQLKDDHSRLIQQTKQQKDQITIEQHQQYDRQTIIQQIGIYLDNILEQIQHEQNSNSSVPICKQQSQNNLAEDPQEEQIIQEDNEIRKLKQQILTAGKYEQQFPQKYQQEYLTINSLQTENKISQQQINSQSSVINQIINSFLQQLYNILLLQQNQQGDQMRVQYSQKDIVDNNKEQPTQQQYIIGIIQPSQQMHSQCQLAHNMTIKNQSNQKQSQSQSQQQSINYCLDALIQGYCQYIYEQVSRNYVREQSESDQNSLKKQQDPKHITDIEGDALTQKQILNNQGQIQSQYLLLSQYNDNILYQYQTQMNKKHKQIKNQVIHQPPYFFQMQDNTMIQEIIKQSIEQLQMDVLKTLQLGIQHHKNQEQVIKQNSNQVLQKHESKSNLSIQTPKQSIHKQQTDKQSIDGVQCGDLSVLQKNINEQVFCQNDKLSLRSDIDQNKDINNFDEKFNKYQISDKQDIWMQSEQPKQISARNIIEDEQNRCNECQTQFQLDIVNVYKQNRSNMDGYNIQQKQDNQSKNKQQNYRQQKKSINQIESTTNINIANQCIQQQNKYKDKKQANISQNVINSLKISIKQNGDQQDDQVKDQCKVSINRLNKQKLYQNKSNQQIYNMIQNKNREQNQNREQNKNREQNQKQRNKQNWFKKRPVVITRMKPKCKQNILQKQNMIKNDEPTYQTIQNECKSDRKGYIHKYCINKQNILYNTSNNYNNGKNYDQNYIKVPKYKSPYLQGLKILTNNRKKNKNLICKSELNHQDTEKIRKIMQKGQITEKTVRQLQAKWQEKYRRAQSSQKATDQFIEKSQTSLSPNKYTNNRKQSMIKYSIINPKNFLKAHSHQISLLFKTKQTDQKLNDRALQLQNKLNNRITKNIRINSKRNQSPSYRHFEDFIQND